MEAQSGAIPTTPAPSVDVRDVGALRTLAHPLRGRLLGLLRLEGPSTATLLAQRVDESSGSTSYHLRQLAEWGFVREVTGRGSGRERWWEATARSTHWETADVLDEPGGRELVEELGHLQVSQQRRVLAAHAAQREELDDDWRTATSLNDWALHLTADGARELADELNDVLRRWRDTREVPGAPLVHVLLDVFPLAEYPL